MSLRHSTFAASIVIVALALPSRASAQPSPESYILNRPTVSPYLNLLQTNQFGQTPYQTLVRPLIEQRDEAQRQGLALQQLQQRVQSGGSSYSRGVGLRGTGQTGREPRFMNYTHYYIMPRR